MKQFIIASHGKFAEGIADSVRIIAGEIPNLHTICAYMDGNTDPITEAFEAQIAAFAPDDDIVVFTDIIGGSVNQQLMPFMLRPNVNIISGMNLSLMLSILLAEPELSLEEAIDDSIKLAKKGIVHLNTLLKKGEKV